MEKIPEEITITPLGLALGYALEIGLVTKEDPNLMEKFKAYWKLIETKVIPYVLRLSLEASEKVQITEAYDLSLTKEVYETKDSLEAAKMIGTGKWTIINGCIQGEEVLWILCRFK